MDQQGRENAMTHGAGQDRVALLERHDRRAVLDQPRRVEHHVALLASAGATEARDPHRRSVLPHLAVDLTQSELSALRPIQLL